LHNRNANKISQSQVSKKHCS